MRNQFVKFVEKIIINNYNYEEEEYDKENDIDMAVGSFAIVGLYGRNT